MRLRLGTERDASAAARLHASCIEEGFLSSLGPRFLQRLYRRTARSSSSFLAVAEDGGDVIGFAAATEDTSSLYREFLLRDAIVAGLLAAPRLLRSARKVVDTLRYPTTHEGTSRAELLAVAVSAAARGKGTGRALVELVVDELRSRGVTEARVVVASNNAVAISLYEACGFHAVGHVDLHRDASSCVLRWSPPS